MKLINNQFFVCYNINDKRGDMVNKKKYDDSWMYILLLTTLIILAESIKGYRDYRDT